jgi:hypothetical protein
VQSFAWGRFADRPYRLLFAEGKKRQPPIIGRTCAFDAKIYKIVDGIFGLSACGEGNKKNFKNCDFCFQLPALLIDFSRGFCLFSLAGALELLFELLYEGIVRVYQELRCFW